MSESVRSARPRDSVDRGLIVGVAVVAIVLGLVAVFFPRVSLVTIAVLFGLSLVVVGLFRAVFAFLGKGLRSGVRWFVGIVGLLIFVTGIVCLIDPGQSLAVLGLIIGIGWLFEGITGILAGAVGYSAGPRWTAILGGVVAVAAGVVMMILPVAALAAFVTVGGILLIVVGIAMLLHLPARVRAV